jgi:hypothetical protein
MLIIVKLNTDVPSSPLPKRMTIAIQSTHLHTRNPVPPNATLPRKPFTSIPATETLFHLFDCAELVWGRGGGSGLDPSTRSSTSWIRGGFLWRRAEGAGVGYERKVGFEGGD